VTPTQRANINQSMDKLHDAAEDMIAKLISAGSERITPKLIMSTLYVLCNGMQQIAAAVRDSLPDADRPDLN
jgi:hypothetical protein